MTCIPIADRPPGEYPVEALPYGWQTAEVTFAHTDGKVEKRYEIIDRRFKTPEGKRYPQEPMAMVAFKCFNLFLVGLPLYFLAYTAVHLIRLPIVTLLNCSPTAFVKQIWTLVRIPFYFIALEFAALYGVFKPLEGRASFAQLESQLHGGKSRRDSVQYKDELPFLNLCWKSLSLKDDPRTFFAGFCMQPIGMTDDPHILRIEPQIPPAV